jgi:putative membrane protein
MRFGVIAAAALGFAVAIYLVFRVGLDPILHAVTSVGPGGFAIICGYALALILVLAAGWSVLVGGGATFSTFVVGRQIRDSASDVLPFSQLGGIVIGARAVVLRGLNAPVAFASAIADVTTELMAQIVFIGLGIAICISQLRLAPSTAPLVNALLIGIALMVPGVGAFVVLQQRGSKFAESLAERWLPAAVKHASAFQAAIGDIYSAKRRLAFSATIHLLGWIGSGIGTWITLRLMGGRIPLISAIGIEALLAALRSAFVFVPSAIGVQEVGYATLLPLFGLPPELGIGASLLKRARELTIGIPVLLAWQAMEGKRAFSRTDLPEASGE